MNMSSVQIEESWKQMSRKLLKRLFILPAVFVNSKKAGKKIHEQTVDAAKEITFICDLF